MEQLFCADTRVSQSIRSARQQDNVGKEEEGPVFSGIGVVPLNIWPDQKIEFTLPRFLQQIY